MSSESLDQNKIVTALRSKFATATLIIASISTGAYLGAADATVSPDSAKEILSTQDVVRDAIFLPHFAKASGIAETLNSSWDNTAPSIRADYVIKVFNRKRTDLEAAGNEEAVRSLDMLYSEGQMEAKAGEWTSESLDNYIRHFAQADVSFMKTAIRAEDLLEAEGFTKQDARLSLHTTGSAALASAIEGGSPSSEIASGEIHQKFYEYVSQSVTRMTFVDAAFKSTTLPLDPFSPQYQNILSAEFVNNFINPVEEARYEP